MLPQSLFFSLLFTLISSPLCSSSFLDDPLANLVEHTPGFDPQISTINKDQPADDFDAGFGNRQMKYEVGRITESSRYGHLGSQATSPEEVSVEDFRAQGYGDPDDTEAFQQAWDKICSSNTDVQPVLVVPENKKYYVKPITFLGPCKSDSITLKILGTIEASEDPIHYQKDRHHWLKFYNITNLKVEGDQGTIEGNGMIWWKNSCKKNKTQPCTTAPTAISFVECHDLKVHGLNIQNAQEMHVSFEQSINVQAVNIIVNSSGASPNTDGIHLTRSENVQIINPIIKSGDDCISIVNGSKNIEVRDVTCGPGHGISIGSLGGEKTEAQVSNVLVNGAKITGTLNGVRIKTWQGGSGYAENIIFQNIKMDNVSNPIIIDQNYCDQKSPCKEQRSAVQVRNIVYKNITGTSASKITTTFNCSKTFPCEGIIQQEIDLVYKGK